MGLWLTATQVFAGLNLVLLAGLGSIWARNFRQHGATHTLGLLILAGFLFVENVLWLYFYTVHEAFRGWFLASGSDVQIGMAMLCGLELVALLALGYITWQ